MSLCGVFVQRVCGVCVFVCGMFVYVRYVEPALVNCLFCALTAYSVLFYFQFSDDI